MTGHELILDQSESNGAHMGAVAVRAKEEENGAGRSLYGPAVGGRPKVQDGEKEVSSCRYELAMRLGD